ncbi:hypothetical protein CHS0354_014742 [Potamilus streckersoni]|uniref:Uncharacterized protein n=1 Tax=Potamilus streckersoni TaxID=2493646 RepID=A0AAE0VZU4_9BIVA|nr:hypothetical protein CHS0354_014742 [Potamilus streckersoni]
MEAMIPNQVLIAVKGVRLSIASGFTSPSETRPGRETSAITEGLNYPTQPMPNASSVQLRPTIPPPPITTSIISNATNSEFNSTGSMTL